MSSRPSTWQNSFCLSTLYQTYGPPNYCIRVILALYLPCDESTFCSGRALTYDRNFFVEPLWKVIEFDLVFKRIARRGGPIWSNSAEEVNKMLRSADFLDLFDHVGT